MDYSFQYFPVLIFVPYLISSHLISLVALESRKRFVFSPVLVSIWHDTASHPQHAEIQWSKTLNNRTENEITG